MVGARVSPPFRGRVAERQRLDGLLERVRHGEGAALVVRGEAGIGKTALMRYCARQASGCRVTEIVAVEAELELPFAALHELCAPALGGLAALPDPQRRALEVAFGLSAGSPPDRFMVGLAVLGLVAEAASERPVVWLIDDAQWLDEATRQIIEFVGRRLLADPILILAAVRETGNERLLPALPPLTLDGLTDDDARALLMMVVPGYLDEQIRDRIVAETGGNPLGLLELPRGMSQAELAGGFGMPGARTLPGHIEDHYLRRIRALPEATQQLMLLAAADPTGDATLLWRAAETLGVSRRAAGSAEAEQLLEIGSRVRFRHPLVRSATYGAATSEDRCAAHLALAEATDAGVDPERRVWHLAAGATGPDEAVASELERTANTAQARAGLAAAAAFLQRAVELTDEPARRAERALAAAQAQLHAGAFESALSLLAESDAVAVDDLQRGRAERLRGQVQWASRPGAEAPPLLLEAARKLERLDVQLARETYLEAWMASFVAGGYAHPGGRLPEISRAARAGPPASATPGLCDYLLDGNVASVIDGRAASASSFRAALEMFLGDQLTASEWLQWGHHATHAAVTAWDIDSWGKLSARHVDLARGSGALAPLAIALSGRAMFHAWCGDFEAADAMVAEETAVKEATGQQWYSPGGLLLTALRGRSAEGLALTRASYEESTRRGEGQGALVALWTRAILCNGLGQYADALAAAREGADGMEMANMTGFVLIELIEAAARTHQTDLARQSFARLSSHTIDDADWSAGLEARSRALVVDGTVAENSYVEALAHFADTPLRFDRARTHLLFGEWLRREGRRIDARQHLGEAHGEFADMGASEYAERARRELLATGEKVRKRQVDAQTDLTPQEEHIARLARDGRTNAEIGAAIFISVRTVEWHLRNVFTKLGITSRRELGKVLPARGSYGGREVT